MRFTTTIWWFEIQINEYIWRNTWLITTTITTMATNSTNIIGCVRESGESIVYFAGKFTLDWLYVTRLQHHLKTKCKIPLKSTWSPKFSIFLGYLPRIWFNLINYTFHVFKVVKNSQYQKFYSSKIKFFRCYKRYLCEAGERAYSCPSPSALIAGGATGSCWLLRLLRGPAWHCESREGRDMVSEGRWGTHGTALHNLLLFGLASRNWLPNTEVCPVYIAARSTSLVPPSPSRPISRWKQVYLVWCLQ